MTGFKLVNLKIMVEELGEEHVKGLLSSFSCPLNRDVEGFLKTKAIEFARQGFAQTHLVFASYRDQPALTGYFSLSNKYITVRGDTLKGNARRRIRYFAMYDTNIKSYCLSAPLIAQLGKNYTDGFNRLISGDELLKLACEKVSLIQLDLGGKFVYLECEHKPKLLEFYESNGFCEFDRRMLDPDETGLDGEYLVQLLKYIK